MRCGPYRSHTREGLYAYPDLVVVCGPSQYHDQARDVLLNPTVIVEVLSPSTEAIDRGDKLSPLSPPGSRRSRTTCWWRRTDRSLTITSAPRPGLLLRRADAVGVGNPRRPRRPPAPPSINCTVPLAEVYERIVFPQAEGDSTP